MTATLEGIIAQRLVRQICPNCKAEYTPSRRAADGTGASPEDVAGKQLLLRQGLRRLQQHRLQGPTWASTRSWSWTTTCAT